MPETAESPDVATSGAPPPDWVPVDRRWLGMDRRTLVPAGLVALLVVVTFWVLPFIDAHTSVDDPIEAGDVIRVDAGQFVPATGWNLEDGLRAGTADSGTYPERATLTHEGVTFTLQTGEFSGTATDLLDQLRENNDKLGRDGVDLQTGRLSTFTTSGDEQGVLARFSTTTSEGLIGALVLDGTGIEVSVYGPTALDDDPALASDIVSMIRSIQLVDGADS